MPASSSQDNLLGKPGHLDAQRQEAQAATFGSLDLAQFAYFPASSANMASPLRRSPQKFSTPVKAELPILVDGVDRPQPAIGKRSVKRETESPTRSAKKIKRGYAAPETYAHLKGLPDWLKEDLDVMFCGINPGCTSSATGHHFASPTNHFYRCLFLSGFTTRLLPPAEDHTLPELCSVGLTNLVERPSAEAAELSPSEMADSVPSFMGKVARYRPRIVCFVGMGIWRVVEKSIAKTSPLGEGGREVRISSPSKDKSKKSVDAKLNVGLQPYKLVHDIEPSNELDQKLSVRETFFFVIPSTSGRVVSHQLPDKVKLFTSLKTAVENYKLSQIDSSQMAPIMLPKASTSPDKRIGLPPFA